jgi:guanosine-3',5'-bis(diphosphate) 3'-pyrophosphohydrolase
VKFQSNKEAGEICSKASFASFDEMLVTAGYGKIPAERILHKLFPQEQLEPNAETKEKGALSQAVSTFIESARKPFTPKKSPILIQGIDDVMIRFAKCCSPLPGDEIMGFISRGRGVIVHRISCPEALAVDRTRWVDVSWGNDPQRSVIRDVKIRVVVQDNQGLMNEMTKTIAAKGVNIKSINIKVNQDKKAVGTLDLEVTGRTQLMACIKELSAVPGVISVDQV